MSLGNAIAARAAALDAQRGVPRWATVVSVDPSNHVVKVMLQPEGVLTGWVPVLANTVGNGWGMVAMPAPDQQVLVLPEYGDAGSPVVIGTAFSAKNRPPQVRSGFTGGTTPAAPGEMALVHQSGAFLRLCADGSIIMHAPVVRVDGALHVSGDVIAGYSGGGQVSLQNHTHTQGNDGHGDGEVPTNPPTPVALGD